MNVLLNEEVHQTGSHDDLFSFLESLDIKQWKGLAVAVNQQVIPKSKWKELKLKENDQIILIEAIAGG